MQHRTTHPQEVPADPPAEAGPGKTQVFSRRNVLATLGIAAAGGVLTMVNYTDDAQAASTPKKAAAPEHAWCMVIDLRSCDGCKACTMACQQRHQLREEQTWINVYDMTDSSVNSTGSFAMYCLRYVIKSLLSMVPKAVAIIFKGSVTARPVLFPP